MRHSRVDRSAARFAGLCLALALSTEPAADTLLCVSDEGIHCFADGRAKPVWRQLQGQSTHTPANLFGSVVAGSNQGIVAFAGDGAPQWRVTEFGHAFTPTAAGGQLFFGTLQGNLVSTGAGGGVRWHRSFTGWMYSPAIMGDVVVSGGQAGVLHAVRRATGDTLWELALNQELVHRPVALDERFLLATTFAGSLFKLDAHEARVVWQHEFGVPSRSPKIARGLILCSLFDGRLVAVADADGSARWRKTLPAAADLAVLGDRLLAHDEENLSVIRIHDGELVARRQFDAAIVAARWLEERRIAVFLRDMRNQLRMRAVNF